MKRQELEAYKGLYRSDLFEDHLLQSVLSLVQDGITFLSKELEVLYANPAMRVWYDLQDGYTGKKCHELYHGKDSPCEDCPALKAVREGVPAAAEKKDPIRRNRMAWLRLVCVPVMDHNKNTVMIIEYVRDGTDKQKTDYTIELMQQQIDGLCKIIRQKEDEYAEKKKNVVENISLSIDVVLRYLRRVLDDESYEIIRNQLSITDRAAGPRKDSYVMLSERELVIARYIAMGYTSREIADKIGFSKKTADYHRTNIRKKLNLLPKENLREALQKLFTDEKIPGGD